MGIKTYRSLDGRSLFRFSFVERAGHVDIYCLSHPGVRGRDSSTHKTHLYPSGLVCFQPGREPRSTYEAETRARQFAEYLLRYARTGIAEK